jgi:hypothetical protein
LLSARQLGLALLELPFQALHLGVIAACCWHQLLPLLELLPRLL